PLDREVMSLRHCHHVRVLHDQDGTFTPGHRSEIEVSERVFLEPSPISRSDVVNAQRNRAQGRVRDVPPIDVWLAVEARRLG
ncbi:hypothetical protein SB717_35340, partial [Priestia sp. SIMBA_032]|uniref:hypothetical protein n=1 Tax=Priestia sp. SIMBA_032 TaxID=3085775 RepID=UPI00397E0BA7